MPLCKDPEKEKIRREKIRQAHLGKPSGMLGKTHPDERKARMSMSNKGKHNFSHTDEAKAKISEASKRQKGRTSCFKGLTYQKIGRGPSPLLGRSRSEEDKLKISKGHLARLGQETHSDERDNSRVEPWKAAVKKRDNYTCQRCGIQEKDLPKTGVTVNDFLHAHHIKSWREFPELRYDVDNGVTLCYPCHKAEHNLGES